MSPKTKERQMSAKTQNMQEQIALACAVNPSDFIKDPLESVIAQRREAEERAATLQRTGETTVAEHLAQVLERFRARSGATPMSTAAELVEYRWKNNICPELQSLGLESRHIQRIAPAWGNPAQERVFGEVSNLCKRTGAVVALIGMRGAGKTTIAAQLMRLRVEARDDHFRKDPGERELLDPPDPGRYIKLGELGAMFKPLYADFGTIERDALAERLNAWINLELLVIDEVHESEDLKTHARLLVDVVDHRYARKNDTLLISNHDGAEFRRIINPSILSRIGEHGKVIECRWPSRRAGK